MPRTSWPCSPSHSRRGTTTKEGCPQPMFKDLRNALHNMETFSLPGLKVLIKILIRKEILWKLFKLCKNGDELFTLYSSCLDHAGFFLQWFSWTGSLVVGWGTWLQFSWLSTEQFQPNWCSQESECLKMANWMLNSNAMTFDALFPNSKT